MEMTKEESEYVAATLEISRVKNEILDTFHSGKDEAHIYLTLVSKGITYSIKKSNDGIEDLIFEGGINVSATEIFDENERLILMADVMRITGLELAENVRHKRARQTAEKEIKQRKFGGPKMRR